MKYSHWSASPVRLCQRDYPQCGHPKPNGLWFDVDEGWKRWCESAKVREESLCYRHSVTILDESRILFLKTAKQIDAFTRRYGQNFSSFIQPLQNFEDLDSLGTNTGQVLFNDLQKAFSNYILWGAVAENYGGIVLFPYSKARSRTYLWYWEWSCAGGCVWDTSIIQLGEPRKIGE